MPHVPVTVTVNGEAHHAEVEPRLLLVHFLREQRKAEQQGDTLAISDSFRHIELGLAGATDVTLVVSPDEGKVINDLTGAQTAVVPLANPILADVPGPGRREGVVFVGGFEHDPNVDAARYLARTIMPLVWRRRPDVTLTIVGGAAPPEVRELAGPNVVIAGWVSDLDPVMNSARVSAAPVRYGAGVKGKVAQALASGVPVVTTAVGALCLEVYYRYLPLYR